jgi:hypothetical protein
MTGFPRPFPEPFPDIRFSWDFCPENPLSHPSQPRRRHHESRERPLTSRLLRQFSLIERTSARALLWVGHGATTLTT